MTQEGFFITMQIPLFQIDAFTNKIFRGNPAAVCILEQWLADDILQNIATENSLAETAFVKPLDDGYEIRWFTPEIEMDLCGHATLASAHVIARYLNAALPSVRFYSKSGTLDVKVEDELLIMDFPSRKPGPSDIPQLILDAVKAEPVEVLKSRDYVMVFESEEIIRNMRPDQAVLNQINLDPGGVCVTAKGDKVDFVSRFFTPQAHIFEDPVTGSAHCSLIPFWSERLNKTSMKALQLSPRGGELMCRDSGERVLIAGRAVTYLKGEITL